MHVLFVLLDGCNLTQGKISVKYALLGINGTLMISETIITVHVIDVVQIHINLVQDRRHV